MGEYARRLNSLSKFVVSSSLQSAPWGQWQPAEIIANNVIANISALKEQPGKDIVIWGSLTLTYELMKNRLIDEIQLRVCPAVLGDGIPVFPAEHAMNLLDAKTFDEGMVLLRYEPV